MAEDKQSRKSHRQECLCYMLAPHVRYNKMRHRKIWRTLLHPRSICNPGQLLRPALPDRAERPARSARYDIAISSSFSADKLFP